MGGLKLTPGGSLRAGVSWGFAIAMIATFGFGGCGGSGTSTSQGESASPSPVRSGGATSGEDRWLSGEANSPGEARPKPTDEPKAEIKRSTDPAQTDGTVGSPARETGRRACAGLTPLEAARRYEVAARAAGVEKRFAAMVADPPPSVRDSAGYPRLVAAVFAATLPAAERAEGAAGCAEELARSGQ